MKIHSGYFILGVLLLNITGLFISFSLQTSLESETRLLTNFDDKKATSLPREVFQTDLETLSGSRSPVINNPRFSVQQNLSSILSTNIDDDSVSYTFVYNIWDNSLNSDSAVLAEPALYENGIIYPVGNGFDSESLFVRIGNSGTDHSNFNSTLNTKISGGISAGWQIELPIIQDYEMINISFKWRYDVFDPPAFDNYTVFKGEVIEPSSDFQEIRCRIIPPAGEVDSFWLGNQITNRNPNGTVFYRVGPIVTQDEEWFNFTGSVQVPMDVTNNYVLELGSYLNSREYNNEYFDVWFDDIEIIGINNVTDTHAPQPTTFGLERTNDVFNYRFWASFSEGIWESAIKNITVYYNRSGIFDVKANTSLDFKAPNLITAAGYNQTYWIKLVSVNVNDTVDYRLEIFDSADNKFITDIQSQVIGDFTPPEIVSTLDPTDPDFIFLTGYGTAIIRINTSDWGFGVDKVVIEYQLGENPIQRISMTNLTQDGNITVYEAVVDVPYEDLLKFSLNLNDTKGNIKNYSGFSIYSDKDNFAPNILIETISQSTSEEGHVFVTTIASDPFGEIERVSLSVRYANNDSFVIYANPQGTGVLDYSNIQLLYNETTGFYEVRSTPNTPKRALQLPYRSGGENNFTIIATVIDKSGNSNFTSHFIVITDTIAPKIQIKTPMYTTPGLLNIWVQAVDRGSGVERVTLQRKRGAEWGDVIDLYFEVDSGLYHIKVNTAWIGNEKIVFRINAIDKDGNTLNLVNLPEKFITTRFFVSTAMGLVITETIITTSIILVFTAIKVTQRRKLRTVRRRRFDIALRGGERLAYLGEEAMFGFVAAYGQGEGITSTLLWEPSLIGHFYQYLKELVDRANNAVDFVMQTRAEDMVTYVDFMIEEISCSAITFAYPVAALPQKWISTLSLEHTPETPRQGVLFMMLLMREKWSEVAHTFQDEITEGMQDIKNYILTGEDKEIIRQKIQEFRLFISGTVEILEEIETDMDDVTESIMGDFDLDDKEKE